MTASTEDTAIAPTINPWWSWVGPPLAIAVLAVVMSWHGPLAIVVASLTLLGSVVIAVHHAEVIAHRVGEPFGTLVLAVAVTVIEVALIVSVMVSSSVPKPELARDTVFATIMIVCNGVVGLCLLLGGVRHHEQGFQQQGASAALAVLAAMAVLSMLVPTHSTTVPGPGLANSQLLFEGFVTMALYLVFVFVQTVRHRDYFLPKGADSDAAHLAKPSNRAALASLGLLLVALSAVVGLAKALSPAIESGIARLGAPAAVVGIVIATVVLLPESFAALRAARADRLQTSLNLALGSALASIGLTIPTVAVVSIMIGQPISLGLPAKESIMLALTLLVGVITLGTGRTTVLQGAIHLLIFLSYLFFAIVP